MLGVEKTGLFFSGWVNMVSSYYWTFAVYPQFSFSYIAGFGCGNYYIVFELCPKGRFER